MTKGQEGLVRYRLSRAEETLEEAKVMLLTGHPFGAANRICLRTVLKVIMLTGWRLRSKMYKKS